jgi:hypothetical protein
VDICTPTPSHAEIVAAAASAGRHVICEKPLALSHDETVEMVRLCRVAGVQLHLAHVVRYFPAYAWANAAVDAGAIGTVRELALSRRGAVPVAEWFSDETRSGGLVVDLSIHDFDFARLVAGEVRCLAADVVHGPLRTVRGEVVLHHVGRAISRVTGEWASPGTPFATSFLLVGDLGELRDPSALPVGNRGATDGDRGEAEKSRTSPSWRSLPLRSPVVRFHGLPPPTALRRWTSPWLRSSQRAPGGGSSSERAEWVALGARGPAYRAGRSTREPDDLSDGKAVREPVHPGIDVLEGDRLRDELFDGQATGPPEVDEGGDVPRRDC